MEKRIFKYRQKTKLPPTGHPYHTDHSPFHSTILPFHNHFQVIFQPQSTDYNKAIMKLKWIGAFLLLATTFIIIFECCKPGATEAPTKNEFTGNISCQSCHKQEHNEWLTSHHYMAMLPANDSTVYGDFNNATFTADGVTTRFFKREGKFYIHTEDETGAYREMEVKYIFGFTPLQQYLVEFPGGRMQPTRMSWDTKAKKWFNQYAGEKMPAGDWLHWTGNGQNWNTMCASCHSTNVNKGYDELTDTYKTTYNDINVSCESCHGPGKNHIDYVNGSDYKDGKKTEGSLLLLYKTGNRMAAINTCGYCHARRGDITGNPFPGPEVMEDYIPELPTTEFFFADGQMNDEDYNYTSFLQSKMFHRGVQCTNCHNPHTNKLKLDGSLVCSQCHAKDAYESEKHTLHKIGSAGVNCISCHMPSKIYMGNDLRHDHSFRIPRPDLTAKYGTPNTCNACHSDKSPQWAADAITKGYGKSPGYHWSEDLVAGSLLDAQSEPHLGKLAGDSAVPSIVRAATMRYLGQLNNENAGRTLLNYLGDSSAMVRYTALKGLRNFDPQLWLSAASSLLSDKVRAVRIAAADLYLDIPQNQIPQEHFQAYTNAKSELDRFIHYQTDFAQGNLQAGDYFQRQNDLASAAKYYKRAILKDSQLVNARVNLAANLNATGKNSEALQQLQIASKIQPTSDHIFYTLGLLYSEMGDVKNADAAFRQAVTINPANIRALYNYGLLLSQNGRNGDAEKLFIQALKTEPTNGDVLFAITILYVQEKQFDKAIEKGRILKQFHGNNPAYAQLLQNLKLQ
jgi:tetratricopeptide (TPR) repeat protein